MTLKVIGAGFGRTGTDSMREALSILGFGPCHHMFEVTAHPVQKERWRAFVKGAPADWPSLFEGYASCVDWPSAHYWRELVAAYPKARVVLTWRSPKSWWESYQKTILQVMLTSEDRESLGIALVAEQVFGGRPDDRAHVMALYEANVADVMATVPAERLLVHRLGDGWGSLCAHLGVATPDQPYPDRNARDGFEKMFLQDRPADPPADPRA
jgi:hypothetical protein